MFRGAPTTPTTKQERKVEVEEKKYLETKTKVERETLTKRKSLPLLCRTSSKKKKKTGTPAF